MAEENFEGMPQEDVDAAFDEALAAEGLDNFEEPVEEEAVEEEEDPDEDDSENEAPEHLKDAVEGNLRLKRLLSRDEGEPSAKRRKEGGIVSKEGQSRIIQLLAKWGIANASDVRHVLEGITDAELKQLFESNYMPNKFDQRKSPTEQVAQYCCTLRERICPGSHALDSIAAFKFKHKLTLEQEKLLRSLCHKDLRFVVENFTEGASIEDLASEAAHEEPKEDTAEGCLPDGPGSRTLGRFHRLELIDPLADAVVFGDANLSFSLKLAQHRKALGHVGRVIATTFEEIGDLRQRYKEIDETIKILEDHCAEVWHGVDCTRIAVNPRFEGMEGAFGAVYYNFPHSGAVSGFFDGHPLVNWRHENLMRLFFRALRSFVKPGGIVKVASNASAVGVRYSYVISGAAENEFQHVETFPFLEWSLHRYGRSYGDRRDTYKRPGDGERYNAQRADSDMVYTFKNCPTDEPLPKQGIRRPPTMKTLLASQEGPFRGLPQGPAREKLAKDLYDRFMTEISGTHVG